MDHAMSYDPNNIFAKILRGEAPCTRVYEDAHTLAFMDIMPQTDGHVLVIPKESADTLMNLSDAGGHATLDTARKIARALQKALAAPGIYIAQMNGAAAGQTVPHFHIHVIPRHGDDRQRAHASVMADPAALEATAVKIRAALG
ncbi:MAG: HIT family protein [Comamonadaceae bacterium]|nr:MAG: HIT family protein [Comamonadaceae bacterium]